MNGDQATRLPGWWKGLIFWRIGIANIVAYIVIFVALVVTQYQGAQARDEIKRTAVTACRTQQASSKVLADLIRAVEPIDPHDRAAFDAALRNLAPRRC